MPGNPYVIRDRHYVEQKETLLFPLSRKESNISKSNESLVFRKRLQETKPPSIMMPPHSRRQASIDSREDPSFRLDADETAQGQVYGTPMPPGKPANPEFSSGPCKKRPG